MLAKKERELGVFVKDEDVRVLKSAFDYRALGRELPSAGIKGKIRSVEMMGDKPTGAYHVDVNVGGVIYNERLWGASQLRPY